MTESSLIEFIAEKLIAEGYKPVATPFTVASVRFEFAAALRGIDGRSSDLVLLIDTTLTDGPSKIGERTRQRLEALSRALDVTGSRFVLTVVLAGAALPPSTVESITRGARVLVVPEDPRSAKSGHEKEAMRVFIDRLRILLPLEIGEKLETAADPLGKLLEKLPTAGLRSFASPFIELSSRGERAVEERAKELLETELSKGLLQ